MHTRPARERSTAWPLVGLSCTLVVLLAATWLIVALALSGASTGVVSAGRTSLAALGLWLLSAASLRTRRPASGGIHARRPYTARQLLVLAATGVAGYTVLSTLAIRLAGPAVPSLVLSLSPALLLILEARLTRTPIGRRVLAATLAAVLGAALFIAPRIAGSAPGTLMLGVLAALGAMLSMTAYSLYFPHVNRDHEGPLTSRIAPVFAVGSIPLLFWAGCEVAAGERVEPADVAILVALGLGVYVPAYVAQHRILLAAGPSYTALLGLAVPPLVAVASVALGLAERPVPVQIAGVVLTMAGMAAVIRMRVRRPGIGNDETTAR